MEEIAGNRFGDRRVIGRAPSYFDLPGDTLVSGWNLASKNNDAVRSIVIRRKFAKRAITPSVKKYRRRIS